MSVQDKNGVFYIQDTPDLQEGIWSGPLSSKSRRLVWSILCATFLGVLLTMQASIADMVLLPSLIGLLVCAWLVGTVLIAGSAAAAVVVVILLHFAAAAMIAVVPIVLISSFFAHLAAILVIRLLLFRSPTRIRPAMFLMVIGVLAYSSATRNVELRKIREARLQNPFVNIDDRLAYEFHATAAIGPNNAFRDNAGAQLDSLDRDWQYRSERVDKLREIHSSYVERFAGTPGFGVGRMPPRQPLPIPEVDLKTITLNQQQTNEVWPKSIARQSRSRWDASKELDSPWVYYPLKLNEQVEGFDYHFAASKDFLNPATFGYVNEQREVAGFIEHAFHNAPPSMEHDQRVWSLTQLKLVSLLQFEEPQVYETENLPRMDEISSLTVPTRGLDEFEINSLDALSKGEETRLQIHGDELRMLGALRARQQCMECHNVEHGELLGAFTYSFVADQLSGLSEAPKLTSK